jgi:GNAT superfamily N-acetyltransferase
MIKIQNIGPNEWKIWKHQRLAALANAPYAFSSKLADWENASEQRWRDRLSICGGYQVVASLEDTIVGMAGGILLDESDTAELVSMWVSPAARGRGIGDALVAAVEEWAYGSGATTIKLSVVEDNHSARKLYLRNGFVDVEFESGDVEEINGERVMLKKKQ